jgi:hypothetical protein
MCALLRLVTIAAHLGAMEAISLPQKECFSSPRRGRGSPPPTAACRLAAAKAMPASRKICSTERIVIPFPRTEIRRNRRKIPVRFRSVREADPAQSQ